MARLSKARSKPKPIKAPAAINAEQWLRFYRQMLKIRLFEEQVNQLYLSAKMPGLAHLYIGQEAVAVGVCAALRRDDYITSTHRGHGHCLAKGASPDRMFAELLGKAPGYCRGKGGSMHIADPETGNLGANAIVGGSAGIATGAALSAKMRGTDQVSVCFFGEGALGQGLLYETMNMASLWKLPVVYVCENNQYNEYTNYRETTAGELTSRPAAFGIETESIPGQDVGLVYAAAVRSVKRARDGKGPSFLICHTYRFHGHHVGDIDRAYYRTRQEEEEWKNQRDPLKSLARELRDRKMADDRFLAEVEKEIDLEIKSALQFALDAPFPEPGEVHEHVYA
ncbi:MAG: thiamine pyrophosphate-dependent dehydrogenase E1 component subunit alpha [Deltaproteobacteria bacterium]|nr:thiamine pyrophosphate-dependent dehydrogenase E1 component subunit alpha [Deltaproteobacteria bacterium]